MVFFPIGMSTIKGGFFFGGGGKPPMLHVVKEYHAICVL
jgi:hypothetical protein